MTPRNPSLAVDCVVFDPHGRLLLIRRKNPPFQGQYALPGGYVDYGEATEHAAARELAEETGLAAGTVHLEQLASYGDPGRDPRMRVVTVAYLALAPGLPLPRADTDAAEARWAPADDILAGAMAFDHHKILADGIERARAKLEYTPLAAAFCPPQFTITQLRRVYEAVWGATLDPRNFHRKATRTPGFLSPARSATAGRRGRPAQLYRKGPATLLYPPMLRASSQVKGQPGQPGLRNKNRRPRPDGYDCAVGPEPSASIQAAGAGSCGRPDGDPGVTRHPGCAGPAGRPGLLVSCNTADSSRSNSAKALRSAPSSHGSGRVRR
jgi:8-oxo-dGTP diphosphatase